MKLLHSQDDGYVVRWGILYNLMKLVKKSIFGGVVRDISRRVGDDDGHLAMAVVKTGC